MYLTRQRRLWIAISLLVITTMLLTACAPAATPTATPAAPVAETPAPPVAIGKYNEAPMLAERVKAGQLPPVDERLPEVPATVRDVRPECVRVEVGKYGGTLRLQTSDPNGYGHMWPVFRETMLSSPGLDINLSTLEGNILQGFEISDDHKTFTFHMRKGLKWSDGAPVTTEDIRFYWEDIINNTDLTARIPVRFMRGGQPMTLEIIDDYTYRTSFAEPYDGFLVENTKKWASWTNFIAPSHYLKQFHPAYTPLEQLEPQIAEEGFEPGEWWRLFSLRRSTRPKPDDQLSPPTLEPWIRVKKSSTELVYERNPYYFKVDEAGNQLPYIDIIHFTILADPGGGEMNMVAGDVDFERAAMPSAPLVLENKEKNRMNVTLLEENASVSDFFLNLTHEDPVWRQVVRDIRFRQAINYAIPRPDLREAVKYGQAEDETFIPGEYNLEKANQLLDEMGLDKRDAEGWRLGPDGNRFVIPIEYGPWIAGEWAQVAELLIDSFQQIGLFTTSKQLEGNFWIELSEGNQIKATIMWSHYGLWPFIEPDWMPGFGGGLAANNVAPLWRRWIETNGAEGEEPEQWYKDLWAQYQLMFADLSKKDEAWANVQRIWRENIPFFTTFFSIKNPLIVKEGLRNVATCGYVMEANMAVEQWYWGG